MHHPDASDGNNYYCTVRISCSHKNLIAQGFGGLVDGWVDTIEAAMEEAKGNHFDLADDPIVTRLISEPEKGVVVYQDEETRQLLSRPMTQEDKPDVAPKGMGKERL